MQQDSRKRRHEENTNAGEITPPTTQKRTTKRNIPNTIEDSFNSLKKNIPSLERCCARKQFKFQKGGYRQQTLAAFKAFVFYMSGGDVVTLLGAYFESSEGMKVMSELKSVVGETKLEKLMKSIHQFHSSKIDNGQALRLVAPHFSKKELNSLGWSVSDQKLASARKPLSPKKLPSNCHPISEETKKNIIEFYKKNTHPAGNKTCYSKKNKMHVPVLCHSSTIKKLHRKYNFENETKRISYSKFRMLKPHNVKSAKRKLDMCEYCVNAEKLQQDFAKRQKISPSQQTQSSLGVVQSSSDNSGVNVVSLAELSSEGVEHSRLGEIEIISENNSNSSDGRNENEMDISTDELRYNQSMKLFMIHKKVAKTQRKIFNQQRESPNEGEVTIVVDFKENFVVGGVGPVEVGKDFFSRIQISCLGCAVYIGGKKSNGESYCPQYYDFLSEILSHDASFVKDCLSNLIEILKERISLKKVNFWFDNGRHFRNKELCSHLICEKTEIFDFDFTINYFAEHHGKSPVDSHFSMLTRLLKEESRVQTINTIDDLKKIFNLGNTTILIYDRVQDPEEIRKIEFRVNKKPLKFSDYYCIGASSTREEVFVTTLSGGEEKIICQYLIKLTKNIRKTKRPPQGSILRHSQRQGAAPLELFPKIVAERLCRQCE